MYPFASRICTSVFDWVRIVSRVIRERVRSAECEVRSAECRVRNAECGVWWLDSPLRNFDPSVQGEWRRWRGRSFCQVCIVHFIGPSTLHLTERPWKGHYRFITQACVVFSGATGKSPSPGLRVEPPRWGWSWRNWNAWMRRRVGLD